MLDYIKNLLPRLKQYSKDLDKIENFVDREWVLIDDGGNNQTYEFMRDGRLVMTLVSNNGTNQHTQIGSWDLLGSGRLLITRPQGALTLNQGFLGDKLLILQESGTSNNPFCCYDPKKITQTEINNYLDAIVGGAISSPSVQLKLNSEGEPFTGFEKDNNDSKKYNEFKDGKHIRVHVRKEYETSKGPVSILQKQSRMLVINDFVYKEDKTAENDFYRILSKEDKKIADCSSFKVNDGKISEINTSDGLIVYVAFGFFIVVALFILAVSCFGN
jgi:hypothetical protein